MKTRGYLSMCTENYFTDTVENRIKTWIRLIALFGLVKPSTCKETHEHEHDRCGQTFICLKTLETTAVAETGN